jgi:hypothetical protein
LALPRLPRKDCLLGRSSTPIHHFIFILDTICFDCVRLDLLHLYILPWSGHADDYPKIHFSLVIYSTLASNAWKITPSRIPSNSSSSLHFNFRVFPTHHSPNSFTAMSTSNSHQSQPITQIPSRSPIPQTATLTPAPVLQICPPAPDTMTHPLSTGTTQADASSSHHTTSLEAQRTGGTSNADAQGVVTPPVPMVSLLHRACPSQDFTKDSVLFRSLRIKS